MLAASTIGGCSLLWAQSPYPQYGRKPAPDKGPRALGLIQLSPKGDKGRILPIAIMLDGKFYDASAYKANPVPMALDFGIVYEGFRTGISQGLFTISQPGQLNHTWIAEGTWFPAGTKPPETHKKYSEPVIADDEGDKPVLHRRVPKTDSDSGAGKDKKDESKPATAPAPTSSTPPSTGTASPNASTPSSGTPGSGNPGSSTPTSGTPAPQTAKAPAAPASTETAKASSASDDEPIADPNRPRLRRGKPPTTQHEEPFATFGATDALAGASSSLVNSAAAKPGATASASDSPAVVLIPAISDASGPDARPYTYDLKPAEEAMYRNRMLALATAQLQPQAAAAPKPATPTSKRVSAKAASKTPEPMFDDLSLRIFDLSSSNEPVLVFSAKMEPATNSDGTANGSAAVPKEITLIARTNLEGELQKLYFSQTDTKHLDLTPRMELIDAVDADGDGRGELLFRRTFDGGSAYAIYRVTADGLWPLFEGTP